MKGTVAYESLESAEPTPVLDILNTLGYSAEVIPTPQEIEEAIEKARASAKRRSSSTHHNSDSGIGGLGLATGVAIGAGLFGD